ncbi:MAG: hypothetical protein KatS3mg082_2612 [Nitrospiraceae bacterium]|nr:MAG: hypothetical protein KatS3mg082_2612 [Nitrospiraceae bacterium]
MKPVIRLSINGTRLNVRAGSRLATGIAKAAATHGWLRGRNLPRTAVRAEHAAYAALRRTV